MALVDLDELHLRCRDKSARDYIEEAVKCYKTGAYRSSIVATWNAVVFDFLHKLRELELFGNQDAKQKLEEFEKFRTGGQGSIPNALKFERDLLDLAADKFELLEPMEKQYLSRLLEDRHRSAHPSMQTAEDPYHPSPELARLHIRNAVDFLLSREPVQGKSAVKYLFDDIKSTYFPTNVDKALVRLRSGPLSRAKSSLIRSFFVGATKHFLLAATDDSECERFISSLQALERLHTKDIQSLIQNEFHAIIARMPDDRFKNGLWYLSKVSFAADATEDSIMDRLEDYIRRIDFGSPGFGRVMESASLIARFQILFVQKIPDLGDADFARIASSNPHRDLMAHALDRLQNVGSYRGAESVLEYKVLPLAASANPEDISAILDACADNGQVWDAAMAPDLLTKMFESTISKINVTHEYWTEFKNSMMEQRRGGWGRFTELEKLYEKYIPT